MQVGKPGHIHHVHCCGSGARSRAKSIPTSVAPSLASDLSVAIITFFIVPLTSRGLRFLFCFLRCFRFSFRF